MLVDTMKTSGGRELGPGKSHGLRGSRTQNIENNPMQSSFGGRRHARSREDI